WVMREIARVRDLYGAAVARIVRFSVIGIAMVALAMGGVVGLSRITPTGFLPEDDQGALFVVVQLPGGASIARTSAVIRETEDILKQEAAISDYTSGGGLHFIDSYSQSNPAFIVVTLKPFDERKDRSLGVRAVMARLAQKFPPLAPR